MRSVISYSKQQHPASFPLAHQAPSRALLKEHTSSATPLALPLPQLHLHPALSLLQDACKAPPVTTFIQSHSPSLTHLEKNPPVVLLWL